MAFIYSGQYFICAFVLQSLVVIFISLQLLHPSTAFSMRPLPFSSKFASKFVKVTQHGRIADGAAVPPRLAAAFSSLRHGHPSRLTKSSDIQHHFSSSSRLFSITSNTNGEVDVSSLKTPLFESASHLLNGLDTYVVNAEDGHPLAVYGIDSADPSTIDPSRRPILMLHGRTWSSVPVYHLLGGKSDGDGEGESEGDDGNDGRSKKSRSLMEAMYDAGLQPYAMDFRGFGGTPTDATKTVIPNRCVLDVEAVLEFISKRHGVGESLPALMGWSQGALVAQLLGQKAHVQQKISKLILYGSIYDPVVSYPRVPLFTNQTDAEEGSEQCRIKNTFNSAIEDFTVEGSIPPDAALEFADSALLTDPYKAQWSYLCQFNNCDPARIHVPTLVVAGDQDPYAPLRVQAELFSNLGRGNDRTWSVITDADHAVHLLDHGRDRFLNIVTSFVENSKKGEKSH